MSLETFTLIHVVISLVGIAIGGHCDLWLPTNQPLDRWTIVFLVITALTSLTGFLFPFGGHAGNQAGNHLTGGALYCRCDTLFHAPHLQEDLRHCGMQHCVSTVFLLVVQSFEKVPSLKAIAPTQKEPPFAIAQITVLLLFVLLTTYCCPNAAVVYT